MLTYFGGYLLIRNMFYIVYDRSQYNKVFTNIQHMLKLFISHFYGPPFNFYYHNTTAIELLLNESYLPHFWLQSIPP